MLVLHVDVYQAGAVKGLEGSEVYLIACCGMCSFAAMEPVSNASAKTFASALMRIILRYGFCHTVILDKDSKFMSVFKESLDLLNINYHVLSGDNHNSMLVERVNRYLNEGLCIMTNERDSVRIALEAILLFTGDWAINKCRHMCFGQRFTWTTDCHAIKFILSYDGKNPAILRLQMRFMCWDVDIEHRNDIHLTDADYFSHLGSDLCYNPLLRDYIQRIDAIKQDHPSPSALPIEPQHMPYYRGPRLPKFVPDTVSRVATTLAPTHTGSQHLANWPISFGFSAIPSSPDLLLSHFDWAVYGFNSGHFVHTIRDRGLPFRIVLAADPFSHGRALLHKLTTCPTILSGASALLDHIRGSGLTSKLTGYLIHSHRYQGSEPTRKFWDLQAHIVTQFRLIRSLSVFAAFVHPDHDGRAVSVGLVTKLRADGWVISDTNISYASYGDSVSGTCRLIVGVHSNTERNCAKLEFKTPPTRLSRRLGRYLWAPFNRPEMAVSYSMNDPSFNSHAVNDSGLPPLSATVTSQSQLASIPPGVDVLYYLHQPDHNPSSIVGSSVISVDGLCPPFVPDETPNLFGHHYGIEFLHDGHTYVQPISPFEFVSCHQLGDDITYKLSHPSNTFCLDAAVPGLTSACIFGDIHERCIHIRAQNCELFDPRQYAAPAAFAQTFLNGAVGVRLPSHQDWVDAYTSDPVMSKIITFVQNPGLISNKALEGSKLNANYRSALRHSLISLENWYFDISGDNRRVRILHPIAAHPISVSQHNLCCFSC